MHKGHTQSITNYYIQLALRKIRLKGHSEQR